MTVKHPNSRLRLSSGVLAAAALLAPLGASAVASEPRAIVLPSETCRGLFVVPLAVGNERAYVVVDTGASRSFLDPKAAARLAGRPVRPYRSLRLEDARIGEFELGSLRAYVYPLDRLGLALGRPIDGILGFPDLGAVLTTFDYPSEEIRVERGRLPRADGREIFDYSGWRRPHLDVAVGGRRVRVQFDTGSTHGWMIPPDDRLLWVEPPRPARAVTLFSGAAVDEAGRLDGTLTFGPLAFRDPVVTLSEREPIVGWRVLRHFEITFDQRKKRVRLRAERSGPVESEALVGTGIAVRPRPGRGSEVLAVLPGAGRGAERLRPGDLVVAIDGVPVADIGCEDPYGSPPGRIRRYEVERDGARIEADVETRILIP